MFFIGTIIIHINIRYSVFPNFPLGFGGYPNGGAKAPKPGKLSVFGYDCCMILYTDGVNKHPVTKYANKSVSNLLQRVW